VETRPERLTFALEWEQVAAHNLEGEKRGRAPRVNEVDLAAGCLLELRLECQRVREELEGLEQHADVQIGIRTRIAFHLRAEQIHGANLAVRGRDASQVFQNGSGKVHEVKYSDLWDCGDRLRAIALLDGSPGSRGIYAAVTGAPFVSRCAPAKIFHIVGTAGASAGT